MSESLEKPGTYYLQFDVPYNPTRVLNHVVFLISMLPHLCGFYLKKANDEARPDLELAELTGRYFKMLAEYEERSQLYTHMLDRAAEAEDRIREGADFDEVYPG